MRPTININDVIVVKKCEPKEFQEGDIITFLKDDKIISHRIEKIIELKDRREFITKGDNNDVKDDGVVKTDMIYGKVIFHIPKIGNVVEYIQDKNGFIRIAILVVIGFILINMNDEKKNRRKMTRKKYEIKKKREKYN